MGGRIAADHLSEPFNEFGAVPVERYNIGKRCREPVIDRHFSAAGFVQHRDFYLISKLSPAIHQKKVEMLDETIISDRVVGDVSLDVFDQDVISQGAIVQRCMMEARVFLYASGQRKSFAKNPDLNSPRKVDVINLFEITFIKLFRYEYFIPVFGFTLPGFQYFDFLWSQVSHKQGPFL